MLVKRKTIPSSLKAQVWNNQFGKYAGIGKCFVCESSEVDSKHFECGHIKSVKEGGDTVLENLRVICSNCNKSMGAQNMMDFKFSYFNFQLKSVRDTSGVGNFSLRETPGVGLPLEARECSYINKRGKKCTTNPRDKTRIYCASHNKLMNKKKYDPMEIEEWSIPNTTIRSTCIFYNINGLSVDTCKNKVYKNGLCENHFR